MKLFSVRWLSYFAGLTDGEGSIIITKNGRLKQGVDNLVLQVIVTNTCRLPLAKMKRMFGGSVLQYKNRGNVPGVHYAWRASACKAAAFLRRVQPYLLIKREQAKLGLRFAEQLAHNRQAGASRLLSSRELVFRTRLRNRVQALNCRKGKNRVS